MTERRFKVGMGHTLAGLTDVLGPIAELSSVLATRRGTTLAVDVGKTLPVSAPEQMKCRSAGF
jgi:hypothetical protein